MIRVSFSGAEKSIDAIWLWHTKASSALRERLLEEQVAVVPVARPVFLGMSLEDITEFFLELDYLVMLDLLSAAEATIRVDFWTRVQDREKDVLSRAFREIAKQQDERVSLEEHILDAWVQHKPEVKASTGDFKGALKLRNWLAHGRYWTPKLARKSYSPLDVFDICEQVLVELSLK